MRLQWDNMGEKLYETGNKQGTLFVSNTSRPTGYNPGVAWNGLTGFTESPSGAESNPIYADDIKYADLRSAEEYGATIEAYTYPKEWKECDGSKVIHAVSFGQQKRKPFGFACVTTVGNDTELDNYGHKLHILYNGTASPSEKGYQTISDSPEAITFSWEITTTPVAVGEVKSDSTVIATIEKPVASITIDTSDCTEAELGYLKKLEDYIFGAEGTQPTLPTPADVLRIMSGYEPEIPAIPEGDIPVTGISIAPSTATIDIEGSTTLTPTIVPATATNKNVTWTSSDDTIAIVNNGVVTGVAAGTATITATSVDGGFTDTATITVDAG